MILRYVLFILLSYFRIFCSLADSTSAPVTTESGSGNKVTETKKGGEGGEGGEENNGTLHYGKPIKVKFIGDFKKVKDKYGMDNLLSAVITALASKMEIAEDRIYGLVLYNGSIIAQFQIIENTNNNNEPNREDSLKKLHDAVSNEQLEVTLDDGSGTSETLKPDKNSMEYDGKTYTPPSSTQAPAETKKSDKKTVTIILIVMAFLVVLLVVVILLIVCYCKSKNKNRKVSNDWLDFHGK